MNEKKKKNKNKANNKEYSKSNNNQINENVNVDLWDTIKDYFNNEEVKNTKEPKTNQKNMKLRIKKNHNNNCYLKLSNIMSNDPVVFMTKVNKYNIVLDINELNIIITKYYPNYDFLHILNINHLDPPPILEF